MKFKKSRKLETLTLKGYYGWSFISCEFFFNSIVPKGHKSFISFLEPVGENLKITLENLNFINICTVFLHSCLEALYLKLNIQSNRFSEQSFDKQIF